MGQYYSVTVPITRIFGERELGGAKHLTTEDMEVFIEDKTHKEYKGSTTLRGTLCFLVLWGLFPTRDAFQTRNILMHEHKPLFLLHYEIKLTQPS